MRGFGLSTGLGLGTVLLLALSTLGGCSKQIGDACRTVLDCSVAGTRACDLTQPYGYCTLQGCETNSCPTEAVCVQFRPSVDRLTTRYCMYSCTDNDDCRYTQGYHCIGASQFGAKGEAVVLGHPAQRFCAAMTKSAPVSKTDAGVPMSSVADASAPISSGDDASVPNSSSVSP